MNTFCLKSILIFLGCFYFCTSTIAQNWEVDILKDINTQNPSKAWEITSASAYGVSAAVPLGLFVYGKLAKDKKAEYKSYNVIGSIAIAVVATQVAKRIIDRQRPAEKYPTVIFANTHREGHSFPSGHTSLAFATATSLSLQYKKWYVVVPAITWASAVGYSRMKLGEHYPTDVLAGAVVGAGSAYLSEWLTKKIIGKKRYKKVMIP